MAQKKLRNLKEAVTGSRDSEKNTTYYWGEGTTSKKKVWAEDGQDTIQKFHRDLRKPRKHKEKKQVLYSWTKVCKMDTLK